MAALRINILSNYAGQGWMAAMGVAFLPLYVRILGVEAFGLVGLMLSFQSISQVFDFGIGGAANRELSRRSHDYTLAEGSRDLVRTSETVIWLLTALVGVVIWMCSGLMADHWLHLHTMRHGQAMHAIAIMGIAIALLWPSAFYANCLSGLERQPTLNLINATFATLRFGGAAAAILWVDPTLDGFLWWYAAIGAAQSLVTAVAVWRVLPPSRRRARWLGSELRCNNRFAGGLFAIGILSIGVTQLDRMGMASLRPLAELGYYTLALSVAGGLGRIVSPMFNALYPRFSRLVARREESDLSDLYHLSSQYLAVVVAAVAAILIVYAHEVLLLWTGDAGLASLVALPMAILVAGSGLNGLMNIPYALQLANGWTRLTLGLNAASLMIGIPFCLFVIPRYGMAGAACIWFLANLGSVLVGIPIMHRRLLQRELSRWYLRDILPPVAASAAVAIAAGWLVPLSSRNLHGIFLLAIASGATLLAAAAAAPLVRRQVRKQVQGWLASSA